MNQSTNQLNLKYKTFWSLKFEVKGDPSFFVPQRIQAHMIFDNGYGVSVVRGGFLYSSNETYEIAVLNKDGSLIYDTPITNDVIQHLSPDDVTEYMIKIQQL